MAVKKGDKPAPKADAPDDELGPLAAAMQEKRDAIAALRAELDALEEEATAIQVRRAGRAKLARAGLTPEEAKALAGGGA